VSWNFFGFAALVTSAIVLELEELCVLLLRRYLLVMMQCVCNEGADPGVDRWNVSILCVHSIEMLAAQYRCSCMQGQ
jgi:hypothetical protein